MKRRGIRVGRDMENRGSIGWRGFWLLAGVVAMAVMRFGAEDGRAGEPVLLPMMAASLVLAAPCGLPLAFVCQRVWRPGYRPGRVACGHGARRRDGWGVAGGRAARLDAIAIYGVVLGLPVWMAWWWLAHPG